VDSSILGWSLRLGRLAGTDISVHWTFLLFVVIQLVKAQSVEYQLMWLTLLFGTVLVHEFGHIFMARRFGARADKILLWPFGGLAFTEHGRSARQDFWVAFGGPLTHVPIFLACMGLLHWLGATFSLQASLYTPVSVHYEPQSYPELMLLALFQIQMWLFCFNVFTPAFPMDGGQMLVATLLPRLGAERTSMIAIVLGAICGFLVMLDGGLGSMIGIMLLLEAAQLYQLRERGMIRSHPSFAHTVHPTRPAHREPPPMPKVVPLRPTGRMCPQCSRPLPQGAQMCGFCEIKV
jgi:Zn-dependent protease